MSVVHPLDRRILASLLLLLSVASLTLVTLPTRVSAVPTGSSFDHIVIIAMENQHYANVLGNGSLAGCPTGTATFLCSMLPLSSTIPDTIAMEQRISLATALADVRQHATSL